MEIPEGADDGITYDAIGLEAAYIELDHEQFDPVTGNLEKVWYKVYGKTGELNCDGLMGSLCPDLDEVALQWSVETLQLVQAGQVEQITIPPMCQTG